MTITGLAHDAAHRILGQIDGPVQVGMVLGSALALWPTKLKMQCASPPIATYPDFRCLRSLPMHLSWLLAH